MTDDPRASNPFEHPLPVGETIDFLRLIWAVDHALQRRSKSMEATLGITGPQRLVVRIVGRFPSVHAKQLAGILHLHPSSLTALLKRLERRGLIRRHHDERDRRRSLLGLTREGQSLNREAPGTIEAAVIKTLRSSSAQELAGARAVLSRLARHLDPGTDPTDAEPAAAFSRPRRRPKRADR